MSSKVEPPDSPAQQSGKGCCPGPIVLLLHLRAWRSHGLACPGISSLVSHRCASPVSAPTEAAVTGGDETSRTQASPVPARGRVTQKPAQPLRARAGAAPWCPRPCQGGDKRHWWRQPTHHIPTQGAHRATLSLAHCSDAATSCSRTAPRAQWGIFALAQTPPGQLRAGSPRWGQLPRRVFVLPC